MGYKFNLDKLIHSDKAREEYIRKMSTTGGITEAIVDSLSSEGSLSIALQRGIGRSKDLTRE